VASVTAEKKANGNNINFVVLSWDAVDNVSGHSFYYQQEGRKTVQSVSSGYFSMAPGYVFDTTDTSDTPITPNAADSNDRNIDKYIAFWKYNVSGSISLLTGKKYRFGVRTSALIQNGQSTQSDIVWSGYLQF
jgi:hypothetical protein